MYTQFFNFEAQPFSITPDPRFMYSSSLHQEGLAHLLYSIRGNGGFVVLTGEVGTGKTLLCHCLLQHLPEKVDIALILNPRLDAIELLASICDELGLYYSPAAITLKYLIDALNKHLLVAHSLGRYTVLMIDEAQNLSLEVLEQIRLLTNLETATEKLLQIILVGQPELQQLLERPDLRQLKQRISARFHLQALDSEDTRKYIQHRLVVCQGKPDIFTSDAINLIFKLSGGVPRVINMLCDRSLLGAYTLDKRQVDTAIVKQAAQELQINVPGFAAKNWGWPALWLLLASIIVLSLNTGTKHRFYAGYNRIIKTLEDIPQAAEKIALAPANSVSSTHAASPEETSHPLVDSAKGGSVSFEQLLTQKQLTLSAALKNGTHVFNKYLPASAVASCEQLEHLGLHCLADRSSWNKVLSFQRPAIMEFDVAPKRKIFALLKAFKNGKVVLQADTELVLDVSEILGKWNGYYIVLWESPFTRNKEITPYETSQAVSWLRQLIGMPAANGKDYYFDVALREKVMQFQRQHNLLADGVAGGRTLILLQNERQSPVDNTAHTSDN